MLLTYAIVTFTVQAILKTPLVEFELCKSECQKSALLYFSSFSFVHLPVKWTLKGIGSYDILKLLSELRASCQ